MDAILKPGIYFQQVRQFDTPQVWLEDGMKVRLPNGKKLRISVLELPKAVHYTLDRDNRPIKVDSFYEFVLPWRMPKNRCFIAQAGDKNELSLTTVSAVEQDGRYWLVCEERTISIFIGESTRLWSPQIFGKDDEVRFLAAHLNPTPEEFAIKDFKHPELKIGQVAFWNWASGTGAICTGHKDDGSAVLSRIFWRNVPERKELEGLRGFNPGEVVKAVSTAPIDYLDTRFAREVVELEF